MKSTTLIKNGRIHTGDQFIDATDLLIEDDRVVAVGRLGEVDADYIIDASGHIVAPGFIDVQNMAFQLNQLDKNEGINLTSQGVTSCITGNCGNSGIVDSSDAFLHRLDYLKKADLGLNIGLLVGHNSLRRFVLQNGERVATPDERNRMISILLEALEYGAMGMSSGLMYSPGLFADQQEMTALVSSVGQHDRVYATHMRDEGDYLLEAVKEALFTAKSGNTRLLIAHFKVAGKNNWGKSSRVITTIEHSRNEQEVFIDFYPYTATSTVLRIMLLPETLQRVKGNLKELEYTIEDEQLVEQSGIQNLCLNSWHDVVVVTSSVPNIIGKSISSLSQGKSPYQTMVDILRRDPETRVVFHNIASEDELFNVSRLPYVMPTTDGYIYPNGSTEATHPRNYGSFPRVLSRYVLSRSLFSLEEFIRKSTQLPASVFKIKRRGSLTEGYFADIIVFRPENVRDLATYEKPYVLSEGMKYVFVNGQVVLQNGKPTNIFPGRLLA